MVEAQHALLTLIYQQLLLDVCGFMRREGKIINLWIDRTEADDAPRTRKVAEESHKENHAIIFFSPDYWDFRFGLSLLEKARYIDGGGDDGVGELSRVVSDETTVQGCDVGPQIQPISSSTNG